MTDNVYTEHIMDHSRHPRNFGALSEYSVSGKERNVSCGDEIALFVRADADGAIEEVSFTGAGCALTIAATSILTEWAKKKTLADIARCPSEEFLAALGVVPNPSRLVCALLPIVALKKIFTSQPPHPPPLPRGNGM